ncbi:MAG: hypothetical protein OXT67_03510 [Zetaproteobacteria bacterium]|nr:hypothetical protein [Zetaproteobacteria bacterium]
MYQLKIIAFILISISTQLLHAQDSLSSSPPGPETPLTFYFMGSATSKQDVLRDQKLAASQREYFEGELIYNLYKDTVGAGRKRSSSTPGYAFLIDGSGTKSLEQKLQDLSIQISAKVLGFMVGYHCEKRAKDVFRTITQARYGIQRLFDRNHTPHNVQQVNLVGWGRGAVTAILVANLLAADERLGSLRINLFAIDPVPGPFLRARKHASIPANVQNYIGIYQLDHLQPGAEPILPEFASAHTRVALYPMRGHHASPVGSARRPEEGSSSNQVLFQTAHIVRHLAKQHLHQWGVSFHSTDFLEVSNEQLLSWYEQQEDTLDEEYRLCRTHPWYGLQQSAGREYYFGFPTTPNSTNVWDLEHFFFGERCDSTRDTSPSLLNWHYFHLAEQAKHTQHDDIQEHFKYWEIKFDHSAYPSAQQAALFPEEIAPVFSTHTTYIQSICQNLTQFSTEEQNSYLNLLKASKIDPSTDCATVDQQLRSLPHFLSPNGHAYTDLRIFSELISVNSLDIRLAEHVTDLRPLLRIQRLARLHLHGDGIHDLSPLTQLPHLHDLHLEGEGLEDLTALSAIRGLHTLHLHGDGFHDLTPLADIDTLHTVHLHGDGFEDLSPLTALPNLHTLHLEGDSFHDLTPLGSMQGLTFFLRLAGNRFHDLTPLAKLKGLHTLQLEGDGFSDLAPLAGMTGLTFSLDISGNGFEDLSPLADMKLLMSLSLNGKGFRDLSPLIQMGGLRSLKLSGDFHNLKPLSQMRRLNFLSIKGKRFKKADKARVYKELTALQPESGDLLQRPEQSLQEELL